MCGLALATSESASADKEVLFDGKYSFVPNEQRAFLGKGTFGEVYRMQVCSVGGPV